MTSSPTTITSRVNATDQLLRILRWVVTLECLGLGGRYLFSANEIESDIYGLLYFDHGWPETFAQGLDNLGAWLTVAAGCVVCLAGRFRVCTRIQPAALICIAIWMLLIAVTQMMRDSVYPELALAEHAVRYAAPLAMFMLLRGQAVSSSVALLVIAVAATFAAHGYKAIDCYGGFTDLILLSDASWTGFDPTQDSVETGLVTIGILDISVALGLLLFKSRFAALYMTVWGFITAASRITAMDLSVWPESLIRVANGGVPLAILVYWSSTRRLSITMLEMTNVSHTSTKS